MSGPFVPRMVTIHHHGDVNLLSKRCWHIGRESLGYVTVKLRLVKFWKVVFIYCRIGWVKDKLAVVFEAKIPHNMDCSLKMSLSRISKVRRQEGNLNCYVNTSQFNHPVHYANQVLKEG